MHALCTVIRIAIWLGVLQSLSGCVAVGASYGVEGGYNAAFRTKIEYASKLSDEEQARLRQVKFSEAAAGPGSTPKGELVGLACKLTDLLAFKWTWLPELNEKNGKTPEEAARTQLLLKAMQKGANTVAAPSCVHKDGIDWGNNCFDSWVCTGQAVVVP